MNARFWIDVNGAPARITIRPGQTVHITNGGPDCEGWSRDSLLLRHTGDGVYSEIFTEGRDCDGYSSRWADCFCPLEDLNSGATVDGVTFPRWGDSTVECRDEYAEAAGY